jgi:hypothetical protein
MSNLAMVLEVQEEFNTAINYLQEAQALYESIEGDDHVPDGEDSIFAMTVVSAGSLSTAPSMQANKLNTNMQRVAAHHMERLHAARHAYLDDKRNAKKSLLENASLDDSRARLMTITWMAQRVEECRSFGFPEFCRQKMLDGMKGELAVYFKQIQGVFDWDGVPGARKYNKSLENTNNKTDLKKIWQDDPKEVARRVWQWWVANNGNFHYLSIAVRLIVLVQTSSASAERAFSQLGLILDGLGNCALDDVVELRLFERVNREKYQA